MAGTGEGPYGFLTVADFILVALLYSGSRAPKRRLAKVLALLAYMEGEEEFFEPCSELFDAEYAMLRFEGFLRDGRLTERGREEAAGVARVLEERAPGTAALLRRLAGLSEETIDRLLAHRCPMRGVRGG